METNFNNLDKPTNSNQEVTNAEIISQNQREISSFDGNYEKQKRIFDDVKAFRRQDEQRKIQELKNELFKMQKTEIIKNSAEVEPLIDFETVRGEHIKVNLNKIEVVPVYKNINSQSKLDGFNIVHESEKLGEVKTYSLNGKTRVISAAIYGKYELPRSKITRALNNARKFFGIIGITESDKQNVNSGKGIGTISYMKINEWLKNNNQTTLSSDGTKSRGAEKLWQSFVRKGLARKVKRKGGLYNDYEFL